MRTLSCLLLSGCAASATMSEAAPPGAPGAPPGLSTPVEEPTYFYESKRFRLVLPLPGRHWKIDDHSSSFLIGTSTEDKTKLWLKRWSPVGPATRANCETEARLLRGDLPEPRAQDTVDTQFVNVPPGHDTRVVVGARIGAGGEAVGSAVAYRPAAPVPEYDTRLGAPELLCVCCDRHPGLRRTGIVGERPLAPGGQDPFAYRGA